jgi:UDP-GlcNAc:undecaprenyl-phosphate GlcNAc-1-phosphate transferase
LVCSAFVLRYEPDAVVLGVFILLSLTILTLLSTFKGRNWRLTSQIAKNDSVERRNLWLRRQNWLPPFAVASTRYAIGGFLFVGALIPTHVSPDISVLTLVTVGVSLSAMIVLRSRPLMLLRLQVYLAAIFSAYLLASWDVQEPSVPWVISVYLAALTIFLVLSIRVTRRDLFQVTPQDFLILFLAIAVPNLSGSTLAQYQIGEASIMLIVIFYASEFIFTRDQLGHDILRLFSTLSLTIVAVRGLFF